MPDRPWSRDLLDRGVSDLPRTDQPMDLPQVSDQASTDLPASPDQSQPDLPADLAVPDVATPDMAAPDTTVPDLPTPDTPPTPDLPTGPTTGMAVWCHAGSSSPRFNPWNGASFGTAASSASAGRWRIIAGADAPTRDEIVVVGVGVNGQITGQLWNGSGWSLLPSPAAALNANAVSETYWWGADVAYEKSGDAVVVWNNNQSGNMLRYLIWNGSSWSAKTTINAFSGSEPQQMRLASSPKTDELVLVVNDASADDHALVWNGSSWGNVLLLDASGTAENDQTALDVAYEQQSGQAMVVYGKNNDPKAYFRRWGSGGWSVEGQINAPAGVTAQAAWMVLGSATSSNHIALGVLTTGGTSADVWLAVWDGSSWGSAAIAETTATGSVFPGVAVAFESKSGQALSVYGQNGQSTCRYRTWSAGAGWSTEQSTPGIGGVPNSITLGSDPHSNQIMLSTQDHNRDLNYLLWDGASWSSPSQQDGDTGESKNQPFLFLWER